MFHHLKKKKNNNNKIKYFCQSNLNGKVQCIYHLENNRQ